MCGIVGLIGKEITNSDILPLMKNSTIRGLHHCGISYLKDDEIITKKDRFIKNVLKDKFETNYIIGHLRYSTSDLEYNQPIAYKDISIVHNGVITQADFSKWQELFEYELSSYQTRNDTEILLKWIQDKKPFDFILNQGSIACAWLDRKEKTIYIMRNGYRPLWYQYVYDKDRFVFASTKDILVRSNYNNPIKLKAGEVLKVTYGNEIKVEQVYYKPLKDLQNDSPTYQKYPSLKTIEIKENPLYDPNKDYRLPENRFDYFELYYWWSLKSYDADPALYMLNYVNQRMELNEEQRYWIAWLYGHTYNLPTAWVIWNEFPDFENVDIDRLRQWEKENYKRLDYQSDTKWNKGNLTDMFISYRENIGDKTQKEWFEEQIKGLSPYDAFKKLYNKLINDFYKVGRYMAWFYLQTLKETCGLNINPTDLQLQNSSAHTQRQAIAFIKGEDELTTKEMKNKFNKDKIEDYEKFMQEFLEYFNKKYPDLADRSDNFVLETVLCAYKKTFRPNNTRYLRYYLDRQYDDIRKMESKDWWGIDWNLLYQCRDEMLLESLNSKEGVKNNPNFYYTGKITNWDLLFKKQRKKKCLW